jgi:hypothetical protein
VINVGWTRRSVGAASLAVALGVCAVAGAQAPGFVELALAGVGQAQGNTGVAGESRLPVRARDVSVQAGTLRLRAWGARGSVRAVTIATAGGVGERLDVGEGCSLALTFASGQTVEVAPGQGWVSLDARDTRAAGAFEATVTQGRVPVTFRGRFEAPLASP